MTSDSTTRLDDDPTELHDLTARFDPIPPPPAPAPDLEELYARRHKGTLVHRPADIGRDYVSFATNPEARVPFGYEWLDATMRGGIAPGELAVLAGGSSSGKTTLLGNIPVNSPHIPMLFCSIEMPLILLAARIFAMLEGEEYRTLEERIKAGADNLQYRIERELARSVPHLGLMGVGGPSVETLGKAVAEYREGWGENPRLVMIDYLDLMSPASQGVEAVKQKLVDLRSFGKAEELSVLVLHQLKREVLDGRHGDPVRFTDCRYAGETEADHLLATYRRINDPVVRAQPYLYEMYLRTIHVQALKTRSDIAPRELEGHELGFNPDTLRITNTTNGLLEPRDLGLTAAAQVLMTPQEGLFDEDRAER